MENWSVRVGETPGEGGLLYTHKVLKWRDRAGVAPGEGGQDSQSAAARQSDKSRISNWQ